MRPDGKTAVSGIVTFEETKPTFRGYYGDVDECWGVVCAKRYGERYGVSLSGCTGPATYAMSKVFPTVPDRLENEGDDAVLWALGRVTLEEAEPGKQADRRQVARVALEGSPKVWTPPR